MTLQNVPVEYIRPIQLMIAAGFDGEVEYREERVEYPGGSYLLKTITFVRHDKAVSETYMADLFAKWPMITVTEAGRIGLLKPNNAKQGVK